MKKIMMLGLLAVIVAVVAYIGWGKVKEVLVSRAVMQKLAEAGMTREALKKLGEAGYQHVAVLAVGQADLPPGEHGARADEEEGEECGEVRDRDCRGLRREARGDTTRSLSGWSATHLSVGSEKEVDDADVGAWQREWGDGGLAPEHLDRPIAPAK